MGTQLTLLTSAVEFALAGALLALSTYVTLWAGLLSFATVSFAAVGAFTATHLMSSAGLGLWPSLAAAESAAACWPARPACCSSGWRTTGWRSPRSP
ncbi:hypothetical protein ACFQY7_43715 [Actinomadura luteofluorescens]|uniref:hypothetical protein n=1 Tax=Actinomadura luteofluorescens TaxID=46163 RepID=UPI00363089D9